MQDPYSERMSASETRAASGLALVFAFRMLGMFMVLPVLATYGMDLDGATPTLIGLGHRCLWFDPGAAANSLRYSV